MLRMIRLELPCVSGAEDLGEIAAAEQVRSLRRFASGRGKKLAAGRAEAAGAAIGR
ncbi:hypothetical protein ACVIIV_001426 [Bradyrhizobium sp. USDA 4354]